MYHRFLLVVFISCSFVSSFVYAQSNNRLWLDVSESAVTPLGERPIIPQKYRTLQLDFEQMRQTLQTAPLEFTPAANSPLLLSLPLPNGTSETFAIVEAPIMEEGLAKRYPYIKTYRGQGTTDRTASVRLDVTQMGFHAMILSANGSVFIDPYCRNNTAFYNSYYKRDYINPDKEKFVCLVGGKANKITRIDGSQPRVVNPNILQSATPNAANPQQQQINGQLRTYRTVVAATGEYTAYYGGTKALAMAGIVTSINRVTGVYEIDLSVRLVLVANNDAVVYTNAGSDPFSNNSAGALIDESQTTIDNVIGNANYDFGHTFSTGGGGLASLGVPCITGNKASGITGSSQPEGDPYDIDYVAHEMGHQFNGGHSFNANGGSCGGNRSSSDAYEPGSGSTIMSYAGICDADDLQPHSDAYFHARNLITNIDYITNQEGDNCPVKTATNNQSPTANAGADYVIPLNTPFILTGSATDPNPADGLTYCWEQYDLGPAGSPNSPSGNAPIFRSFDPTTNPVRYCPKLNDVINGTATFGELLPTYARNMSFRLTVRDNHSGGGLVGSDVMAITVASSGPFRVTYPNATGVTWNAGSPYTITWNVNNTTAAPVSCANVDIFLSTNGGQTYPITLATGVPNTGTANINLSPSIANTTTARVMVRGAGNIFYDISNNNFTISAPTVPTFTMAATPAEQSVCAPSTGSFSITTAGFAGFTTPINLSASVVPSGSGLTATFANSTVTPGNGTTLNIGNTANAQPGTYTITITGVAGALTKTATVTFSLFSGTPGIPALSSPVAGGTGVGILPTLSWYAPLNAATYDIQVATDNAFTNIVETATNISNTYFVLTTPLSTNTTYYWRARAVNGCATGTYSTARSFTTLQPTCTTFAATDVPKTISGSGTPTVTSTLIIAAGTTITDINVKNVVGTHSWINDLTMSITSPAATTVSLLPQICDDENNFNLNFDDEAANANYPCPPVGGGTYQPEGNLSDFDGQNSQGTWTFSVTDNADQDGGSLTSWSVEVCGASATSNNYLLQLRALLQGAYTSGGNMSNTLRTNNLVPTAQPYNFAPISYSTAQTAASIPTTATDWVLVEVRNTTDFAVVTRRAGFLLNNGNIIDADGTTTGIKLTGLANETPYYIVIRHRNHAPVASSVPVIFYQQQASYDFTTGIAQGYGRNAMATTTDGYAALWAGDYVPNGAITYTDFNTYYNQTTNDNTYTIGDGNLDKIVNDADFNLYRANAGRLMVPVIRY